MLENLKLKQLIQIIKRKIKVAETTKILVNRLEKSNKK